MRSGLQEKKEIFYVLGMSCAGCATNVQEALSGREGVYQARVNFASSTVTVEYDASRVLPADLQKTVQEAGYDLVLEEGLLTKGELDELLKPENMIEPHKFYKKK